MHIKPEIRILAIDDSALLGERIMIVGVQTDFLFPSHQQQELAEQLSIPGRELEYVELESIQGHDSFLVDMDRFRPVLSRFFAGDWAALSAKN